MELDWDAALRKMKLAEAATAKGDIYFSEEGYVEEFDRGCDYVATLIESAFCLFQSGKFATTMFIAITAVEETAKLIIALYRREGRTEPAKRRREDHLFSHKDKHSIALQEVIALGSRLPNAIGEERVRELLDMAETGELVSMREAALYFDVVDGNFTVPSERFSKSDARDLLLLALEVWDDGLVGLTNHTYEIDQKLLKIFAAVENS